VKDACREVKCRARCVCVEGLGLSNAASAEGSSYFDEVALGSS
jgi:hypothetical protein